MTDPLLGAILEPGTDMPLFNNLLDELDPTATDRIASGWPPVDDTPEPWNLNNSDPVEVQP